MKKTSTIFLQITVVLIGLAVLAFLIWEPQAEGVNAHRNNFDIYLKDPFLAYAYLGSLAFFMALYQAFKLFGYMRAEKTFSQESVKALRTIKYCGIILFVMIGAGAIYLRIAVAGKDDVAGGMAMAMFTMLISGTMSAVAAKFEKLWQNGVKIKSENDLTV